MLHSNHTMSHPIIILSLILSFLFPAQFSAFAQENPANSVEILSPLPGEAVQGLAQITGTVDVENFESYLLEFTFGDTSGQTWFPVFQSTAQVVDGLLGEWDTSVLADRVYNLRLTVNRTNSEPLVLMVEGLRVRNYSPIETSTPQPTAAVQAATPTPLVETTPTATPVPERTPTPLPENSASVGLERVESALLNGAIVGTVFVLFWLFYQVIVNKNDR